MQQIIGEDAALGEDQAFDRGMRDVAFVPERDVLQRGLKIRAHDAGQAADLLRRDGVSLMRHGRGSLLPGGEELLGLAHLGALQVPDLQGDLLHARGDQRQRREEFGVAIARDDLRGDRLRSQSQAAADGLLHLGIEMGERADGARDLPHADLLASAPHALPIPLRLRVPQGELQAEGDRLGMDAMRASDHGRILEFEGATAQDLGQALQARQNQIG
ncbi:hypothetical protein HRbin08_01728 [bacterium HR08]|nr:hypothetical protein HRbin08_01728 [bacterium HR08]